MSSLPQYRKVQTNKKSWSILFTLLTLNLWIIYFFIGLIYLIVIPIVFTALNAIILLVKFLVNRPKKKSDELRVKNSLWDTFKLAKKYVAISRTSVILGVYGITLATIIISQSFILGATYSQSTFDNYFGDELPPAISMDFDIVNSTESFNNIAKEIENQVQAEFEAQGLSYLGYQTITSFAFQMINRNQYYKRGNDDFYTYNTKGAKMFEMSEDLYNKLLLLPTFDKNEIKYDPDAKYFFPDRYIIDYDKESYNDLLENKSIIIPLGDPIFNETIPLNNLTINFDYIWVPTESDWNYIYQYFSSDYRFTTYIRNGLALNSTIYTEITDILSNTQSESDENSWERFNSMSGILSFYMKKIQNINEKDLIKLTTKLTRLQSQTYIISNNYINQNNYIYVRSPLLNSIIEYQAYTSALKSSLLLVSIPLIGMAIFLIYFSLSLLEQRKKRVLSIMKSRGTSNDQTRTLLLSEVYSSTIIALISAMILSIPWTIYFMNSIGLIESDYSFSALTIPINWYWKLPLMGIVLALDLNYNSISSTMKISIEESTEPINNKQAIWKRYYLDLIFFVLSTLLWIVVHFMPLSRNSIAEILIFGFGPFALFILLFSTPLVVARYFGTIIKRISVIIWKISGGLTSLATRNLSKNRDISSKLVALLTMGLILSMLALIIPNTFNIYSIEEAKYDIGSDIVINGINPHNTTLMDMIDVDGVQAKTEVISLKVRNHGGAYSTSYIYEYYMLGINTSTFTEAAFWSDSYSQYSIQEIVSSFDANDSIGIQSEERIAMGFDGLSNPKLTIQFTENESQVLSVKTDYKYFPNLVTQIPRRDYYTGGYDIFRLSLLGQFEMVEMISNKTGSIDYQIYVKIKENADIDKIVTNMKLAFANETGITIRSFENYRSSFFSSVEAKIILSIITGLIQIAALTNVVAISYFSFLTLSERKREIGVFRAVGMIAKQLFRMLLIETQILLLTGIIFGTIIGYFISSNFAFLFKFDSVYNPPEFRLYIPYDKTAKLITFLIVSTSIISAIPAYLVSFRQTGSVLRSD